MKLVRKLLSRIRGEQNIEKLIKRGLKVGSNCKLGNCSIDPSHCFHITIGNNVTFGPRVRILAHDASTKVFLNYTRVANVSIGNNVFIGAQTIVMPGVTIGNNVVVGAGSIVTKDIPNGSLAVGAPARVIKSLDEFLLEKKNEMTPDVVFSEEYTVRNPSFCDTQRAELIETANRYHVVYVE